MVAIKFDRSVKYNGIRYAAHEVFTVKNEDVKELKQIGATVMSTEVKPEVVNTTEKVESPKENIDELKSKLLTFTLAEMVKFAEERKINLHGKTRKADVYNIIVESLN